jgi:hypothetical protein
LTTPLFPDPRPPVAEPLGLPLLLDRMNLFAMPRDRSPHTPPDLEETIMTTASEGARDLQIRELSAGETDLVAGAREFGECSDTMLNFGLFSIKVTTCCDGTAVSIVW